MDGSLIVAVGLVQHGTDERGRPLYVVTRRRKDAHLGGAWELPGGKVKAGELAADGVIRELKEELGVDVTDLHPLTFSHYAYPERTVLILFFGACTTEDSAEPQPLESDELRLITATELLALPFPPANEPLKAMLKTLR